MWEVKNAYGAIDKPLESWAIKNGLAWQKEYKDYSVRSYSFLLGANESVQFWVDPPQGEVAVVHVAINSSVESRRKHEQSTHRYTDLEKGLDDALRVAREWKAIASEAS